MASVFCNTALRDPVDGSESARYLKAKYAVCSWRPICENRCGDGTLRHAAARLQLAFPCRLVPDSPIAPNPAAMALSEMDSNYLVCACLAAPHILYAYIWFFPQQWMAAFKKRSVEAFETLAWVLKGASAAADQPCP